MKPTRNKISCILYHWQSLRVIGKATGTNRTIAKVIGTKCTIGKYKEEQDSTALHVASLLTHQSSCFFTPRTFFETAKSSGDFLIKTRQDNFPKVENYFEVTIPSYTIDDFKFNFRMADTTLIKLMHT